VRFLGDSTAERVATVVDAKRSDAIVVFDFRRYEDTTIQLARELHEAGAKIVLVTDRWLSPASAFSEIVLPTVVESPSPFDTLSPAFGLVEMLVGGVVDLLGPTGSARLERFNGVSNEIVRHWGVARRGGDHD
jgi:DNA-binding MurR/RpiR family transcriptional regulator